MAFPALEEGRDYYLEAGLYVFTEYFLRQRGYCCRSGCRHCPYGFREAGNPSDFLAQLPPSATPADT
jgi:hypothetical protein